MKKLNLTAFIVLFCASLFATGTFYGPVNAPSILVTNSETNLSLSVKSVQSTDANKKTVSIPNAAGYLNNDGSGNFSWLIPSTPFLTDFLQAETNSMWTLRYIDGDVADGTASTFNGFGDSVTFASSISGAVATRHNTNSPITGTWAELSVGAASAATEFCGSQTFEAMPPYNGGTFTCQALMQIRNTNTCRTLMGFTAAGLITQMGADNIITNSIYFRYSPNSNDITWHGVVSDGTNMTVVDTGVGLTNDGLYFLSFTKTTNSTVSFSVNRQTPVVASTAVPVSYPGPGYGMAFFTGLENLNSSTGAKTNLLHYIGYKSDWLDDGARGSEGNTGGGGSGGSGNGVDINMTNLTAYVNNTNFFVDFGFPAATLVSTGAIAFQYTTNWPGSLTATSRVCNVSIPATNFLRNVLFQNAATNWRISSPVLTVPPMRGLKLSFQVFGQGETNVTVTPTYDTVNAPIPQVYNLANVTSATNIMLFDASRGTCYNDPFFLQPCSDGQEIKGWQDSSGKGNYVTNFATGVTGETFHNANSALYNVPQVQVGPFGLNPSYLRSPTISTLTFPITVFEMFRVSSVNMAMFDGTDTTHRLMCYAGAGGSGACSIASENTSSFTTSALPYSQNFILYTYHFDAAASASLIRTNAVTAASGTLAQTTCTAVTVCSAQDVTTPQSIGYLCELQVWWGALTTTDYGNIETNYFRAKYHNW